MTQLRQAPSGPTINTIEADTISATTISATYVEVTARSGSSAIAVQAAQAADTPDIFLYNQESGYVARFSLDATSGEGWLSSGATGKVAIGWNYFRPVTNNYMLLGDDTHRWKVAHITTVSATAVTATTVSVTAMSIATEPVSFGANDSGGAGYRVLLVPNA